MKADGSGRTLNFWGQWTALLPLAALVVVAVWPLFQYGPPGDIDAPNHFYRFVALDWHIQHGDWYPRWFTDVNFGLGGPVLNFYAPLSYYILVVIRAVVSSAVLAFALGFALALALAVVGMYGWLQDQFSSPWAGLVGAAAYVLSPYVYINLLRRGALPELWGLALAPWLFWAVRRVAGQPSRWNRLALALLYGALILTHNLSAVLFTGPLLLYALVQSGGWHTGWRQRLQTLLPIGLSMGLSVLLSAFFWLPFLSEVGYIQLQRAQVDFAAHFLGWNELLALPPVYDSDYITHAVPLSLPWPQILLGLIGLGAIWRLRRNVHQNWLVAIVGALQILAFAVLMTAISQPVWNASRLANLIQFPWRLLGPSDLWLAWLSGAALLAVGNPRWRNIAGLGAVLVCLIYVYNWTYGYPTRPYPQTATVLDVNRFEIENPTWAGTTVSQEFLPTWVKSFTPGATPAISFEADPTPNRLAPLPGGVTSVSEQHTINSWSVTYDAPQAFTATFYQFYFPGWAAKVDGQGVEATASDPDGLVQVAALAGRHTLSLSRAATGPDQAGTVLSLIGLGLLFVPWPYGARQPVSDPEIEKLPVAWAAIWGGGLVLLLVLKLVVLDQMQAPFRVAGAQTVPNPSNIQFGNDLAVIGYALPQGGQVAAGGVLEVAVYWQATAAMTTRYSTSVQLVDAYGNRFGQADNYIPGEVPTPFWPVGHYARDVHQLQIPEGAPPGDYHLRVSVYSGDTTSGITPLALQDGSGLDYDLSTAVTVRPGAAGPDTALAITGGSLAGDTLTVGDPLAFTAQYYSGNQPLPDLLARLTLTDSTGKQVFTRDLPPARPDLATSAWPLRQPIQYPQSVILPADLQAGKVEAHLTLVQADGSPATAAYLLGAVNIQVPERTFTPPAVSHPLKATFNDTILLLGYDVRPESLTLYWQAVKPVTVPLTVFIHTFGADGSFVAGQDSPPARATTSWLPGEVITDVHPIAVGERFEVGFYATATRERFGEALQVGP